MLSLRLTNSDTVALLGYRILMLWIGSWPDLPTQSVSIWGPYVQIWTICTNYSFLRGKVFTYNCEFLMVLSRTAFSIWEVQYRDRVHSLICKLKLKIAIKFEMLHFFYKFRTVPTVFPFFFLFLPQQGVKVWHYFTTKSSNVVSLLL